MGIFVTEHAILELTISILTGNSWPGSVQQQKQWTWCSNAILIGYRPHSSSASRFTAGASGFLNFSQSGERT